MVKSLKLLACVLSFLLPMSPSRVTPRRNGINLTAEQSSQAQPTPQVQPSPQAPQTVQVARTAKDCVDQGLAKYGAGDYEGAISDFNEAIQLDPKYADAYYHRGNAKRAKNDMDGAVSRLQPGDSAQSGKCALPIMTVE